MRDFRVGITRDFLNDRGELGFGDIDIGLGLLDAAGLEREFLAEDTQELRPDQVAGYDALLVMGPRITRGTLAGADRLTVLARFGVGYDSVDVTACTEQGVAVTITPEGVRRPVAVAALALVLALAHRLPDKDRLVREHRWGDRLDFMGVGLTGRTLGVIGFGNIGRELCRLARPLDVRLIAADPFGSPAAAAELGVELVELETLLSTSDFACVCCALTPETRHLLNAERLALLKETAFLVNVARGPIVDQQALTKVLRERRIQGAGLDVFEHEPPALDEPLVGLDNVLLGPHALAWTDECFNGNGRGACQSIVDISGGVVPPYVVNTDVLSSPAFRSALERYAASVAGGVER